MSPSSLWTAPDANSSDNDGQTQSLSPSMTEYPELWGRTYHRFKPGSYLYPNDEDEMERLDLQHDLIKKLHQGRLFYAPVHASARRILDIGTGTGIWPVELSESNLFPHAKIIGTDLSPIQPSTVPINVSFEIEDCSEPDWNRSVDSFDFIHTSLMMGALTSFESLIHNARRYLRPGTGWLECHELYPTIFSDDNTIPPNWPPTEWDALYHRASELARPPKPVRIADKIKGWMERAGYVDIQEHFGRIPIGTWPKDKDLKMIGRYWRAQFTDGLAAFSFKKFGPEGLGWTKEQIEVFLASVRSSLEQTSATSGRAGVHGYQKLYVVYGRKPSAQEEAHMRAAR